MKPCALTLSKLSASIPNLTAMASQAHSSASSERARGTAVLRTCCAAAAGALAAITAISNSAADSSLPPGAAGEQQQEANVKPIVVEADASEEASKVGRQEQEEGIGQGPAINIHEEIN